MEQHKYRGFKIKGQKFVVKMDLNPITNGFEYHMYIRHLVTPQQAIAAFFSKQKNFTTNNTTDMNCTVQAPI